MTTTAVTPGTGLDVIAELAAQRGLAMTANTDVSSAIVRSLIPARLDRLPWTRFHTRLVMSLGTAWILDGLEITLASSVAGVLTASDTLRLSFHRVRHRRRPHDRRRHRGTAARRRRAQGTGTNRPPADRRRRDPGPAIADAESSLLANLQAGRPLIGGRLTTGDPARTLREIPRLTSEDSITVHACRYLAARGRHREKDQARPDQHHTPGPRIYAGSRSEAQRRHRGQRPAHPVRSI